MYATTETAQRAHLVLPAAAWGEKDGTFINSERRIGLSKKVRRAPGLALSDFHVFHLIAEAWGCADMFRGLETPEDVFKKMTELSRDQPCDISGIESYAQIDREGGIQWPRRPDVEEDTARERRLFSDGRFYTPNERARFIFTDVVPIAEDVDRARPFFLLTGRGSSSQWHTQTRTGKSEVLKKLYPNEPYVEISPVDASRMGIRSGLWLRVRSKRGSIRARAHVTHSVKPGHVFVPMHYPETNQLTFPSFDPESRQPAYKGCAVSIAIEEEART
jgi:assimilatory nitrate reductase catalytic subunit